MIKNVCSNIEADEMLFLDIYAEKTKTAGIMDYADGFVRAGGMDVGISNFLNSDKFKPNKSENGYLVMSAMGVEEAWGSNMNMDAFKEKELLSSCKTFENGYAYEEHENKDPKKALGKILFSCYNKKI